jgi:hypothetical protein
MEDVIINAGQADSKLPDPYIFDVFDPNPMGLETAIQFILPEGMVFSEAPVGNVYDAVWIYKAQFSDEPECITLSQLYDKGIKNVDEIKAYFTSNALAPMQFRYIVEEASIPNLTK